MSQNGGHHVLYFNANITGPCLKHNSRLVGATNVISQSFLWFGSQVKRLTNKIFLCTLGY